MYSHFNSRTEGEYLVLFCYRSMYLLHGDRVAFGHEAARHVADGNRDRRRPAAQVLALDRQPGAAPHRTVQGEDLPKEKSQV